MHAHLPSRRGRSQLEVLGYYIDQALQSLLAAVDAQADPHAQARLDARVASLAVLVDTFDVLAHDFKDSADAAIHRIALMQQQGRITQGAASELLDLFAAELGEHYVNSAAAQRQ